MQADPEKIPLRIPALDILLAGGLPPGMCEVVGPAGVGKTALALEFLKSIQWLGGQGIYVNIERKLSRVWATKLGLDWSKVQEEPDPDPKRSAKYKARPYDLGDFLKFMMEDVLTRPRKQLIGVVWDSIAATPLVNELENFDLGKSYGRRAAHISELLRRVMSAMEGRRVVLLAINHLTTHFNGPYTNMDSPGGVAIKYYSNTRLRLWSSKWRGEEGGEERVVGQKVGVEVYHSHFTMPYRHVVLKFHYEQGWRHKLAISEALWQCGRLKNKKTGYYAYESKKFHGDTEILGMVAKYPALTEGLLGPGYAPVWQLLREGKL